MLDVQTELVELLKADPYFSDIAAILTQRTGDIDAQIAEALGPLTANDAGKSGLAILAIVPVAKCEHPNTPGPSLDDVRQVIRVHENRVVNSGAGGIQKPAEDVAEYIAATLHQRSLDSASCGIYFEQILLGNDEQYLTYDVILRTHGRLLYQPSAVADPVIVVAGGNVTNITCGTAGATIAWTTDGTRPTCKLQAGVWVLDNSLAFGFPVAVGAGTVVKARAYKAGLRGSEIVKLTV